VRRIAKGLLRRAERATGLVGRLERMQATSPATKIALRELYLTYRSAALEGSGLPTVRETGLRVFSQADEDGILLFLLAATGADSQRFVDIGAGDCVTASNCANLALNLGFHGLFVDADLGRIESGRRAYATHPDTSLYPPRTVQAFVTRDNVDRIVSEAGFEGEIDVLSIDVDCNDYWIWQALTCVQPAIVVIETHTEYRLHDVLAPYEDDFDWRHAAEDAPIGASPVAMTRLAAELGYRLVGGNRFGFNAFYVRDELARDVVPTVGVDQLLVHDWSREPNEWSEPPATTG
jgi:hypothetical protein